jgi:NADPH-dependent 2,4-dienoyl-CoA reductase/sulfur reductase-like enzyme
MRQPDVAVAGGGPAGIGAAIAAAESGASVLLIDEHRRPAGQYFKGPPEGFEPGRGKDQERIRELRSELERLGVEVLTEALVWGIFGGCDVMVAYQGRSEHVRAGAIVLAPGAYDRPVPFPGWTLPGVMTAGGAQTFVKAQRVLPGRRILLAGAGPFLLPVARGLAEAGADVTLVEATPRLAWLGLGAAAVGVPALVREAVDYERSLRRLGVKRLAGHKIVRAVGKEAVEAAVICRVDRDWRAVPGTERTLEVDAIAIGYGFLPSTELAESSDLKLRFDPYAETWFVETDDAMETSEAGVFAAGEITGIGGNEVALMQGRLAGIGAAARAGRIGPADATRLRSQMLRRLRARQRFAASLNRVFRPRPGLWEGLVDDVVVCRCEEVRAGEIRERVANGCTSPKALKDWTRAGMGLCQGRVCSAVLARLIAEGTGAPLAAVPRGSVRPPAKPVPIDVLATTEVLE